MIPDDKHIKMMSRRPAHVLFMVITYAKYHFNPLEIEGEALRQKLPKFMSTAQPTDWPRKWLHFTTSNLIVGVYHWYTSRGINFSDSMWCPFDSFLCSFGFRQKFENCEFRFKPSHALASISMSA